MQVAGLCDICGKLSVEHTCPLCGAKVCVVCFDQKGNVCRNCASGRKAPVPSVEDPGLEEIDDDDGIEDLFK